MRLYYSIVHFSLRFGVPLRFARVTAVTFALLLLRAVTFASAQQTPLPAPVGYVNDFAGVIQPDAKARLEDLARRVNAVTHGDMVIVTLADLGGRPVEEVSLRLGREWKVGADAAVGVKARNAGVIILVVPKESSTDGRGHCRIETGQGTEGFITDATSGTLCREAGPEFVAKNYSAALELIAGNVANRYAAEFNVSLDGTPQPQPQRARATRGPGGLPPVALLIIIVVIFLVLTSMSGKRRGGCIGCIPLPFGGSSIGGGGWSSGGGFGGGGGGGGGFGGFGGGGGFSGGGGGSDW